MVKKCLYCKKVLRKKRSDRKHIFVRKKFCNAKCRSRYHANKQYNRIKDNRKYKKYRKKYFKIWRKKNRKHFNDLVREKSKIYLRKIRKERLDKGLCPKCGKKRDSKWIHCNACRKIMREYYKKTKRKK